MRWICRGASRDVPQPPVDFQQRALRLYAKGSLLPQRLLEVRHPLLGQGALQSNDACADVELPGLHINQVAQDSQPGLCSTA